MTDIWLLKPFEFVWKVAKKIFNRWTIMTLFFVGFAAMVFDESRAILVSILKGSYNTVKGIDFLGIWTALYKSLKYYWYPNVIAPAIAIGQGNMHAVYILGFALMGVIILQLLWLAIIRFSPELIKAIQRKTAWFGFKSGLGALLLSAIIVVPLPFIAPEIAIAIKSFAILFSNKAYNIIKELIERWAFSGKKFFSLEQIAKEAQEAATREAE